MNEVVEQFVIESNKKTEVLNLKIRQIEIESYKAQYRLCCQIRQMNSIISIKDQEIVAKNLVINNKNEVISNLLNSKSMVLTRPFRSVLRFFRRLKHATMLVYPAINKGGGVWITICKAVRLYRMHGFEGIKHGLRSVASSDKKVG